MKIPDLLEIAVAWKRAANPTKEQQQLAEERLEVCNSCEYKEFKSLIRTYICGACGCPIQKKVYTPQERGCPKQKWER